MTAKDLRQHFSGGAFKRNVGTLLYAASGYPLCATGDAAYRIRNQGNHTSDRAKVTCTACNKMLALPDAMYQGATSAQAAS